MGKISHRPGRLPDYDYSGAGCYFITFCTLKRKCVLSKIVVRGALAPPDVVLLEPGKVLERYIQNVPKVYPGVSVDKYVIMPNHVHFILRIEEMEERGSGAGAPRTTEGKSKPSVMSIIGGLKSITRRKVGYPLWQTTFHDHVIRNDTEYQEIWQYIDQNPLKWTLDEYYTPEEGA